MEKLPRVVVTFNRRWNYFQWFLLGFYMLREEDRVDLKIKTDWLSRLSYYFSVDLINKAIRKTYFSKVRDSYYFDGYIEYQGKKKTFTIDCSDTPYMYDWKRLREVDSYFKIQCPKELNKPYFELTDEVKIPWLDSEDLEPKIRKRISKTSRPEITDFQNYIDKIHPLMLGPRELTIGNSYQKLRDAYNRNISACCYQKEKKAMCYFGNAEGPKPSKNLDNPDLGLEYDVLALYGNKLNHPNVKRKIVADTIKKLLISQMLELLIPVVLTLASSQLMRN